MKRKLLIMFSMLAGIALLIIGSFHFYAVKKEAQYAKTAVPYIKQVVPELSRWDPTIAKKYMSVEFTKKISASDFAKIVKALSKLGTLQTLGEPHFEEIYSGDTPGGEKQTIISYTVKAQYSTGSAVITMGLLDLNGTLKVYRFNVQSNALALKPQS